MTPTDDPDDHLFGEAIKLSIRQQSPGGSAAQQALRLWRARSPDHERIWAEVAEIQGLSGILLQDEAGQAAPAAPDRRRMLGLVLGAGAAAAAAGLAGPGLITAARADHRTGTGELRTLQLGDGSRIHLGPATAITATAARDLRLLTGMMLCEIAPATTPFRLAVRDVAISTESATFSLSHESAGITLAAEAGTLRVTPSAGDDLLPPGTRQRRDDRGQVLAHGPATPGEASAWTGKRIVTNSEQVAVLVEQIARWLPGKVLLAGTELGARHVAGTFDLRDPEAALAAVVLPHGGRVRRISPWLRVVSAR